MRRREYRLLGQCYHRHGHQPPMVKSRRNQLSTEPIANQQDQERHPDRHQRRDEVSNKAMILGIPNDGSASLSNRFLNMHHNTRHHHLSTSKCLNTNMLKCLERSRVRLFQC